MKKIIIIALFVMLLSMQLVVGIVVADEPASQSGEVKVVSKVVSLAGIHAPMALDGTWVILDQNMPVNSFFSEGPWTWDSPLLPVKFTITDLYVVSDQFVVYDYGVTVATTPSLPDWDVLKYETAFTSPPWTNNPDTALAGNFFSSAIIIFPPGEHSITIQDIHIPPRTAGGNPCSDGTVAFKAEQIDIEIAINIDIKPGSDPNSINLRSMGVVPVAVLTTDEFNAAAVDPGTVDFAGAVPVRWTMEDVDSDGDADMLFHFNTQELNLDENSTDAILTADTSDLVNPHIVSKDRVNVVPKGK